MSSQSRIAVSGPTYVLLHCSNRSAFLRNVILVKLIDYGKEEVKNAFAWLYSTNIGLTKSSVDRAGSICVYSDAMLAKFKRCKNKLKQGYEKQDTIYQRSE